MNQTRPVVMSTLPQPRNLQNAENDGTEKEAGQGRGDGSDVLRSHTALPTRLGGYRDRLHPERVHGPCPHRGHANRHHRHSAARQAGTSSRPIVSAFVPASWHRIWHRAPTSGWPPLCVFCNLNLGKPILCKPILQTNRGPMRGLPTDTCPVSAGLEYKQQSAIL